MYRSTTSVSLSVTLNDVLGTKRKENRKSCVLKSWFSLGVRATELSKTFTQFDLECWWYSLYFRSKFKQKNYRFLWVSTFMWYYCTLKPSYKQIFGSKGSFVFRYRTLEFPRFCVTRHLADCEESSYVGFRRFCYLNIPYLRINITLIFMSSSSVEFRHW